MNNNKRIQQLLAESFDSAGASADHGVVDSILEARLKANQDQEVLEEGWKEVAIGIGMLANVIMPNVVQAQAKRALDNQQVIQQVDEVMNDQESLDKVIDWLTASGYETAEQRIEQNAEKIKDQLSKGGKQDVTQQTVNQDQLASKLKYGYAITGIQLDTIVKEIRTVVTPPAIVDTIQASSKADNFFVEGGFVLSESAKSDIAGMVEGVRKQGGTILNVNIKSSTDKQRVSPRLQTTLSQKGYSADNEGLSNARADAVKALVTAGGVNADLVTVVVLAEQGAGEVGAEKPQDPSARYVVIDLEAVKVYSAETGPVDDVTETQEIVQMFTVAKAKQDVKKSPPISVSWKSGTIKTQTKSPKDCHFFQGQGQQIGQQMGQSSR